MIIEIIDDVNVTIFEPERNPQFLVSETQAPRMSFESTGSNADEYVFQGRP
jgi:hypothetical protein